ncbi:Protein of unknown function (DUF1180) [Popillia japonica]|uniref:Uncharacterized protein n=1 Tax=Popillia japonica TaxID=7064 RepID=A0AAW1IUJ5_POPJA
MHILCETVLILRSGVKLVPTKKQTICIYPKCLKVINMFCSLFPNNLFITSFLLVCLTTFSAGILPENIPPKGGNDETKTKMDAPIEEDKPVILQLPKNATTVANNSVILEKPQEVVTNVSNNSLVINQPKPQDSGALYRLFLVLLGILLLGICALTVVYVSYRFYRMRTGGTRPTAVRKYGVLTQRTDIEMLPLPLDDDEDDDTVFDVGNHVATR